MSGYIGTKASVTQVDGYNRTEADDRYVNAAGDTMTGGLTVPSVITADDTNNYALMAGRFSAGYGGAVINTSANASFLELQVNGFGGLRTDSAGRVTMPYQPAFTGTYVGNMNSSIIRFDNVAHNIGSHYNTATGIFTAPVAGLYDLRCNVLTAANVNVVYTININGTFSHNKGQEKAYYSGGNYSHVPMHNDVYLQAGDTVWIALQSGSLNANVASSDQYNALSIRLVG